MIGVTAYELPTRPAAVQHRVVDSLVEVTFLQVNKTQKFPRARVVLRMLIINVWNKFPNKKFQKVPEMGKRV